MICDYELTINGKVYKFNSERDLDSFLKENSSTMIDRTIQDVRFSKDKGDIINDLTILNTDAYNRLSKYRKDKEAYMNEIRNSRNTIDGEVIPEYTDGYTSVLRYIQNMENSRMQEFNRQRYVIEKSKEIRSREDIAKLSKEQQDALVEKEIKETFAFWDYIQDIGRGLHYAMDEVFHKYDPTQNLDITREAIKEAIAQEETPGVSIEGVTDEALNGFIKSIQKVKMEIIRRNKGKMPKIFTEFVAEGDTKLGDKLRGKIDLLVVNDDGNIDIYDLKITTKPYESWDADKKTATDYQLGFYKRMLETKGIPHNRISCKIIPILVGDYTRATTGVPNSINKLSLQEILPILPTNAEYSRINNLFNVDTVSLDSPIINEVSSKLTKFFPVTMFTGTMQNVAIERIKKEQVNRKEGKWVFKDKVNEDLKIFDTEQDLNEYLNNYYTSLADYQRELVYNITTELSSELEKINANDTAFAKGYISREFRLAPGKMKYKVNRTLTNTFIDSNLETYRVQSGWKVLKSDDFVNMGVIVLINTTSHEIDVISITSSDIFAKVSLPKGKTILGNFYEDTSLESRKDNLSATVGNVELIKLTAIIDEILKDENYSGYRVNNLRVLNPTEVKGQTQIDMSKIFDNYYALCDLNKVDHRDIISVEPYERILYLLNEIVNYNKTSKFSDLATSVSWVGNEEDTATKATKLLRLQELATRIESLFFPQGLSDNDSSVEAFLLRNIYQAIATISGLDMDLFNTEHYSKYGGDDILKSLGNRTFLNGTDVNTTDTVPIIKPVADLLAAVNRKVRDKFTNYKDIDRVHTDRFHDTKASANRVTNLYTAAYENLLDKSDYGKKTFTVKDPWKDTSLNDSERAYLKWWLEDLNKMRYPGEDIEELKATGQYFEIPLLKASWTSKALHGKNWFKASWEERAQSITNPKDALFGDTSVYVKDSDKLDNMYNIFKAGDQADTREEMLSKGDPMQMFETNLEHIKDMYAFSQIREKEYNKVLPQIRSAIKSLQVATYITGKPSKEIVEFITDYIKSAILDETLIGDEAKGLYKLISPIKTTASMAVLGFNYVSGMKETVVGFWNLYSRALVNSIVDKDKIGLTDMTKAYSFVWVDALKQADARNITLLEHLNWKYGVANMDTNSLVERENFDKLSAFRFKSWLYWCNRAPDFLHRMTILVGYMSKKGCLEAYTHKNGKAVYDWKKDKRFSAYAKGDKSNPEYNNQRALYRAMMEEFIEVDKWEVLDEKTGEYRPLTMEDDLPEAFTTKEVQKAVQEANTMFGYMDHDTKSLIFKRGLGTIIGQFQTYLTAKKNQYFLKRDVYNDGDFVHKKDREGNLLYWEYYTDVNGVEQRRLTTNVTDDPYIAWEGKIMEGILWSIVDMANFVNSKNFKRAWNDPVARRNLGYFMSDLLALLFLTWILRQLIKDEPLYKQDYTDRLVYKVLQNTRGDINIFQTLSGSLDFRFVAWDYWTNFGDDAWKVVTGDTDMASFLSNNVSVLRPSKYELKELMSKKESK